MRQHFTSTIGIIHSVFVLMKISVEWTTFEICFSLGNDFLAISCVITHLFRFRAFAIQTSKCYRRFHWNSSKWFRYFHLFMKKLLEILLIGDFDQISFNFVGKKTLKMGHMLSVMIIITYTLKVIIKWKMLSILPVHRLSMCIGQQYVCKVNHFMLFHYMERNFLIKFLRSFP